MKALLSLLLVPIVANAATPDAVIWRTAPKGAFCLWCAVEVESSPDRPVMVICVRTDTGQEWGSALTRVTGSRGLVERYISKAGPDWPAGLRVTVSIRRQSGQVTPVGMRVIVLR